MVYRVRPMREAQVDFEDRTYKLGETIDLRVELNPRSDLDVRVVRVQLICEETYKIAESVRVSGLPSRNTDYGWDASMQTSSASGKDTKTRKRSYVHSSAEFAKSARLKAGTSQVYDVAFKIRPDPPWYTKEGTVKYRLLTVIDVVRGRNPRVRRTVKVALD